jgi:Peptidase family S41
MKIPLLLSSRTLLAALTLWPFLSSAEQKLLPRGAATSWQYLDGGQQPAADWKSAAFDAAGWKSGPAPLGYGEDKLGTEVSFGESARRKPITTWFRKAVDIPEPDQVETLLLQLRRDDGAVVYLNGKEIARSNMPAGPVTADTAASTALRDEVEGIYHRFTVPAKAALNKGRNVIAVEVHQAEPQSSDLIFDLEVTAYAPGESPKADAFAEAQAALDAGDMAAALPLLLKVDTAQPGSAEFLARAARTWLEHTRRPDDGFFALMEKAVTAAPDDMELVYGYIRARVAARRDLPVKPAARKLPEQIPAEFQFIAATPPGGDRGGRLSREEALADVDDLELLLENCYAYLDRRGANWRGALDALRASITGPVASATFQYRVARVLTVFGDPHSRLTVRPVPEPRVPVSFVMEADRLAALTPSRELLDAAHPYVRAINGEPVARWIEAAERIVPQASPQYRRHMALEQLPALTVVARELNQPADKLSLTMENAARTQRVEKEVKPAAGSRAGGSEPWPAVGSELRADGIGYLRIPQMDSSPEFISSLNGWMKKFTGTTRGLIIDVRGNGGGSQDALRTVLPWLMKPADPMKIVNVAAYRLPVPLPKPNRSGFLGLYGRGLHPATSAVWSESQAAEIRRFLDAWKPQWSLPAGKFSDWHIMAIEHRSNPAAAYYEKPVVVLQNEECFSATDNFLGALKGHPGVTLMGAVSGGGSGRMADYQLPNSRLSLTLCQMASFSTAGYTYDGNGVPPDVAAAPTLTDHLRGGTDSVLAAAVKRLGAP